MRATCPCFARRCEPPARREWCWPSASLRLRKHRHRRRGERAGRSLPTTTAQCVSSRPTCRSIPATPAARCSTARRVIGINSQIYSRAGGLPGPVFAIPIDVAAGVEQQSSPRPARTRAWARRQDVDAKLAASSGSPSRRGAVAEVQPAVRPLVPDSHRRRRAADRRQAHVASGDLRPPLRCLHPATR